jgi:hypothetical protein
MVDTILVVKIILKIGFATSCSSHPVLFQSTIVTTCNMHGVASYLDLGVPIKAGGLVDYVAQAYKQFTYSTHINPYPLPYLKTIDFVCESRDPSDWRLGCNCTPAGDDATGHVVYGQPKFFEFQSSQMPSKWVPQQECMNIHH